MRRETHRRVQCINSTHAQQSNQCIDTQQYESGAIALPQEIHVNRRRAEGVGPLHLHRHQRARVPYACFVHLHVRMRAGVKRGKGV